MTGEEALEHAKTLKEFCRDRDNLDDPCEDCPFHFYDGLQDSVYSTMGYIRMNGSSHRQKVRIRNE